MKGRWAFPFFGAGFLLALTVTPAAAVPVLKMHVAGESTELASATNGAVITPTVGPQGTLVVRAGGSVNFAPVQNGNGVFFLQPDQQNSNTAFYQFTGTGLGTVFNVDSGEIELYIKSKYNLAQRLGGGNGRRIWFETYDGSGARLFYFSMEVGGGLTCYFNTGGTSGSYFTIPTAQADTLFGLNQVLRVKLAWNGTQRSVYLNGGLWGAPESYTKATPNWTAASSFVLGSSGLGDGYGGGFFTTDEPMDDFKVSAEDLTPPVVSNPQPTGTLHYSTTQTTISVNTDENATCKYGTSSAAYASLPNTFSTTGGTTHSHLITGLTSGVTRTYYVRCQDTSMNVNTSDTVINFSVGVVDTEDPSTPTGLVATAASYEAINLNWNASTDNIGVTGYRIYRGGSPLIVVPGTSFQDTGLTPSTLYTYRVTALDAGDNESGQSNQASATTQQAPPLVEWTLDGGPTYVVPSGNQLGTTGVTAEIRSAATVHGTRYDVRLRNRTGTDYTHSALRVRLPRSGSATTAQIEELGSVALPAEIRQFWAPPTGALTGSQYVFTYEIWGNGVLLKKVGPAAYQSGQTNNQWGGRTNGIVRIDGKVYIIPEFWERQPRKITVTATEVILTLFEGSEPLRGGEDVWDRFAVLNTYAGIDPMACVINTHAPSASYRPFFVTCPLVDEADALPLLTATQRRDMRTRFTIAPEKLRGPDADGVAMLRRYDRWMGTSWDRNYALPIGGRYFEGEEPDSTKTSLFSLFRRGGPFPGNDPGTMTWREYGDIQWAEGMSALHYDWLRAPFKHYLRTGNLDALRWAMAAARHTVAVDHTWESPVTPEENTGYKAGYSRYEKGDHGTYDLAKASHTWVEGLFIAAAVTGDPWIMEAAVDRAEAAWRQGASTNTCGETRFNTWPLLTLVTAWRETGDVKYWNKAKLFVEAFWQEEQDTGAAYGFPGGLGYATHRCGWGNQNNAGSLMNAYAVKPLMAFAEEAEARGQGEMLPKYVAFYTRIATWLTTPVPNGALVPPNVSTPWMKYAYYFCPVGVSCTYPTDTTGSVEYNNMISDLFFWLAMRDPNGRNPNTNELWSDLARNIFRDALNYSALPDPNQLGLLTTMYPSTETKALGWPQLFNDRAAMWFAHWWPTLNREGGTSRAVDEDRQEGESTTKEEVDARKGGTSRE